MYRQIDPLNTRKMHGQKCFTFYGNQETPLKRAKPQTKTANRHYPGWNLVLYYIIYISKSDPGLLDGVMTEVVFLDVGSLAGCWQRGAAQGRIQSF